MGHLWSGQLPDRTRVLEEVLPSLAGLLSFEEWHSVKCCCSAWSQEIRELEAAGCQLGHIRVLPWQFGQVVDIWDENASLIFHEIGRPRVMGSLGWIGACACNLSFMVVGMVVQNGTWIHARLSISMPHGQLFRSSYSVALSSSCQGEAVLQRIARRALHQIQFILGLDSRRSSSRRRRALRRTLEAEWS
jgi:hypothetical protein